MSPSSTSAKNKTSSPAAKAGKKSGQAVKPKKAAKSLPKAEAVQVEAKAKPTNRSVAPSASRPAENKKAKAEAAPATPVEPAAAPAVTDEQIGQRAYEIWIEKGRPYGQEDANWAQAVAELRG